MRCINVDVIICAFAPLRLRLAPVHPRKCVPKVCYAIVLLRFTSLNSLTLKQFSIAHTNLSQKVEISRPFKTREKHVKNTKKRCFWPLFGHFDDPEKDAKKSQKIEFFVIFLMLIVNKQVCYLFVALLPTFITAKRLVMCNPLAILGLQKDQKIDCF